MSRWPEARTLDFMRAYKKLECLWNHDSPLYKDRFARQKAYAELASLSGIPGYTVGEVRYKIKNLRSTFMQEYKKIKLSKELIASSKGQNLRVYRPTLAWFEDMRCIMKLPNELIDFPDEDFYGTFTVPSRDPLSKTANRDFQQIDTEGDWQMKTEDENASEVSIDYHDTSIWEPIQELDKDDADVNSQSAKTGSAQKPSKETRPTEELARPCCCSRGEQQPKDEFHYFGQNVACQLRKLPVKSALRLQIAVSRMIARERLAIGKRVPRRRSRPARRQKDDNERATSTSAAHPLTSYCTTDRLTQDEDDYLNDSQFLILE